MTQNVKVPLPDQVYQQMKEWAEEHQKNLGEAIAIYLAENLSKDEKKLVVPPYEFDPEVEREKSAYIRLHPQLKKDYYGIYVAIFNGELVDHDTDYGALFERIDKKYPDNFVWLTQVLDEPIGTIHHRSPQIIDNPI